MRIAIVDRELCKMQVCGFACAKVCPKNRTGEQCITAPQAACIDEALCIGCGLCVKRCPLNALSIVNTPEGVGQPMHRYGANQFALFRLPSVQAGKVTGLLGPNGVGKTTALRIVSRELMPNLGRYDNPPAPEEVASMFRGTGMQHHFEAAGFKASFKPQQVGMIPKAFPGSVAELMEKLGSEPAEAAKKLELSALMKNNVAELSGGELQRVAVAAAIGRKADFYFFDEPSSYLDARQRLAMAKAVRSLAEAGRTVMFVEHDLAIADYLADYVHVLYGQPGAFGVVSQLYSARAGINSYLDGYVREDNVRFRQEPVRFHLRPVADVKRDDALLHFGPMEFGYDGFGLGTEGGDIYRGEVVGIVGPNATGKTTFVRMLCGEIGDTGIKLKMSHKPQYLRYEGGATVQQFLHDAAGDRLYADDYKNSIVRPLGLEKLMDRNVAELSGGELQRTFIAAALSRDYDLLLLDEPSAFLDLEQRLQLVSTLRRVAEEGGKAIFVVDHDLQMIDALSNRMIVFDGEPGRRGHASAPVDLRRGMNSFLSVMDITFRRDKDTGRPRPNKAGSKLDAEQRERGEYYYA